MDRHRDPARTHVSFRPSFLPGVVYHHRKPIIRSKRKKKSSKIFVETSNFFLKHLSFILIILEELNQSKKTTGERNQSTEIFPPILSSTTTRVHIREINIAKMKSILLSSRVWGSVFRSIQDDFSLWHFENKKRWCYIGNTAKILGKANYLCEFFSPRSDNQDYACRTRLREILKNKESTELLPWITL